MVFLGESESLDYAKLVRLPPDSIRVEDPDEEIFLLYTQLLAVDVQDGSTPFTGLGSVDSKADVLTVSFDLPRRDFTAPTDDENSPSRRKKKPRTKKPTHMAEETLEIELIQDKTVLRSKRGDTGSVLWRVTREFCRILIRQLCAESESEMLFDTELLSKCHVLEFGAGTGLLALVLSHWTNRFTATDLDYLVPLIQKNIDHNFTSTAGALTRYLPDSRRENKSAERLTVECLNWFDIHDAPLSFRAKSFPTNLPAAGVADIILAIDCVYNPSLLPPLVTVLNHYTATDRTRVIVAVELRSEDVLREFLELWIGSGNSSSNNSGEWVIHRICGDAWMEPCFAVWVGWKCGSGAHAKGGRGEAGEA